MKKITLLLITVLLSTFANAQYFVNFDEEGDHTGTTQYGFENHELNGILWSGEESIIPLTPLAADWFTGVRSLRMRGYGDTHFTMVEDKPNGIGEVSFQYRRYGTDNQVEYVVEISIDQGNTWAPIASPFTAPSSDDVQTFSATVEQGGDARIRIKTTSETGTSNRRLNIEDITITDFEGQGSPNLSADESVTGLSYFENNYDAETAEGSFSVQGFNLTEDVTVTAPQNFEVSLTSQSGFSSSLSLSPVDGSLETTTVFVRLQPLLSVDTYEGSVVVSGDGEEVNVALSGEVEPADPQLSVSPNSISELNYISEEGPSQVEEFTVEAKFLQDDLVITAPDNFEVSENAESGFSSSLTVPVAIDVVVPMEGLIIAPPSEFEVTVYVRLAAGLAEADYSGNVEVSSNGATTQTVAVDGTVFGQAISDMVITGVIDGPLPGGRPKAIELYVINDIPDLSTYGVGSANNGNGSQGQQFTFPEETATAGTYLYIATEMEDFNAYFGFNPNYTGSVVNINGDDAIELFQNSQVIDTFGEIQYESASEQDWLYTKGWAYRSSNTGPDGAEFNIENWIFSGTNTNVDATTNATSNQPMPIGTYMSTLNVSSFEDSEIVLYPNPVSGGVLNIESNSTEALDVELYNMFGKQVLKSKATKNINVSNLSSGLYLVKINQGSLSQTKKLIIK